VCTAVFVIYNYLPVTLHAAQGGDVQLGASHKTLEAYAMLVFVAMLTFG
jgi:hypothetical protein